MQLMNLTDLIEPPWLIAFASYWWDCSCINFNMHITVVCNSHYRLIFYFIYMQLPCHKNHCAPSHLWVRDLAVRCSVTGVTSIDLYYQLTIGTYTLNNMLFFHSFTSLERFLSLPFFLMMENHIFVAHLQLRFAFLITGNREKWPLVSCMEVLLYQYTGSFKLSML